MLLHVEPEIQSIFRAFALEKDLLFGVSKTVSVTELLRLETSDPLWPQWAYYAHKSRTSRAVHAYGDPTLLSTLATASN
jgi:hypothetical protein